MRVPLSWLRDFVSIRLLPETLAERLTMAGIEVESIIDRRKDFDRVVVGEVVDLKPHSNADKLSLTYVTVKRGSQPLEIVCGAPNIAVGQKVPVALLGARLPNGAAIEPRKIRGVASQGMVCAEDELGLGTEHAGIVVLDPTIAVGTPLATALGFDDVVFDLAVPANRPDLLAMRGIAFEVTAILGVNFKGVVRNLIEGSTPVSRSVSVKVEDPSLCPRYIARVIRGIHVRPSPAWLQQRLNAAGIRPINAVVDATNYVMLEYGQPLHAFDAARIENGTITVRRAKNGERMETLDEKVRTLSATDLVIADPQGSIAIAGVMGVRHTEISDATTDLILESALFDPVSIRRTSRRLGLRSEASRRFEKGLPWELPETASRAAAALIVELCGGTVERGSVAVGRAPKKPTTITIAPSVISELLGITVNPARAKKILARLGFRVKGSSSRWRVGVPFWRLDVTFAEDVVDEIGRILGYNAVEETPLLLPFVPEPLPQLARLKEDLRDLLVGFGFTEVMTHTFYGEHTAQSVGGAHFEISNPLDATQRFLRRSLLPQLCDILRSGANAGDDAKAFEIGRVFLPSAGKPVEQIQPWRLAVGMTFRPGAGYVYGRKLTGVLDELFEALGMLGIGSGKAVVQVATDGFRGKIAEWCELDIATIRDNFAPFAFQPMPKYPAVFRDISLWVSESLRYQRVFEAVVEAGQPLLESARLFDVFEKDGRRSYAFHLTFRAADRTLTDAEILAKMKAISEALKRLGAEIR